MTVSSTVKKVTFSGNGSNTSFSLSPITFFDTSEMVVVKVSTTGVETEIAVGTGTTNYSVVLTTPSSLPSTGTVTYPASGSGNELQSGESLVIKRVMPLTQGTDLFNQGGFFPDVLEAQLDRGIMISLQQQDDIDRSLKGPISDTVSVEMPNQSDRASKYLTFDATGVPTVTASGAGDAVVSSFMATVLDDTTAAAARTTLGLGAASTSAEGLVELATTAETTTGASASLAVTAEGLHDMTSLSGAAWFLDDDTFAADSAVKVASQQSIKAYVAANGSAFSQQEFDVSGTWTKPASGTWAKVEVWGAGGGGGHYNAVAGGGGGGGGGAYATSTVLLSTLSATEAVTIGAGGLGVLSGSTHGTIGGTSDFATLIYAYGGGGGSGSGNGGGGGGGGVLSAGSTSLGTSGYPGGTPGVTGTATALGKPANSIGGGGSGGGNAAPSTGGAAVNGGGGGSGGISSSRALVGGQSYMGGGGGGGGSQNVGSTSTGGASGGAGNGGAGGIALAAGSDGVAPAGGGGGAQNVGAAKAGDGAAGRVRVTVW